MNPEHLKALQAGREKAAKARRKVSKAKVIEYCNWCKRDADLRGDWLEGRLTEGQYKARRRPMPPLPNDEEFRQARVEGAKRFDGVLV